MYFAGIYCPLFGGFCLEYIRGGVIVLGIFSLKVVYCEFLYEKFVVHVFDCEDSSIRRRNERVAPRHVELCVLAAVCHIVYARILHAVQ